MSASQHNMDAERLKRMYADMWRIRAFEEAAVKAQVDGLVGGAVHASIGQEAIAVGVCANLARTDQILTTHRNHGHCIAKGTDPGKMMLELFGKEGGTSGGKGGSMHIADFSVGMLGANGVVGAGLPIAVGAAQGAKLMKTGAVVACFFGDGATNRGPFLESLNWAAVYQLPVLFVCESNGFASTTRTDEVTAGEGPSARARACGVEAFDIDGNDLVAVDELVADLVRRIRAGEGPKFVTAKTYRLYGHTASDPAAYRSKEEVEERWKSDPVAAVRGLLVRLGVAEADLDALRDAAQREIATAIEVATSAPWPAIETAFDDVQDVGAPR